MHFCRAYVRLCEHSSLVTDSLIDPPCHSPLFTAVKYCHQLSLNCILQHIGGNVESTPFRSFCQTFIERDNASRWIRRFNKEAPFFFCRFISCSRLVCELEFNRDIGRINFFTILSRYKKIRSLASSSCIVEFRRTVETVFD